MMARYFTFAMVIFSFAAGAVVTKWKPKERPVSGAILNTQPPKSVVICGIENHPCVTYAVSYHHPTERFGDRSGEGFTDYEAKTISIASTKDPVNNVQALQHEVYHAALRERGFKDSDTWDTHTWIYFSEGPFSMVLHDNPDLVRYILNAY
jgi:hypothetical protein